MCATEAETPPVPLVETVSHPLAGAGGSVVCGALGPVHMGSGAARGAASYAVQILPTADAPTAGSRIMLTVSPRIGDTCNLVLQRRAEPVMVAGRGEHQLRGTASAS